MQEGRWKWREWQVICSHLVPEAGCKGQKHERREGSKYQWQAGVRLLRCSVLSSLLVAECVSPAEASPPWYLFVKDSVTISLGISFSLHHPGGSL